MNLDVTKIIRGKVICEECKCVSLRGELLKAPHPFIPDDLIFGCPACNEAARLHACCDVLDCKQPADCGTPSPDGYRQVCGEHYRELLKLFPAS